MPKKILIYANNTPLSHQQLIDKDFLFKLKKNFTIEILSQYDLTSIDYLKCFKLHRLNFQNQKFKFLYFLRKINLLSTFSIQKNKTLLDFTEIEISKLNKIGTFKSFLKIYMIKITQCLLQFKIFSFFYKKFYNFFNLDKNINLLLKKINPDIVITSSPGWWHSDDKVLNVLDKKIKKICIISSWDQPTGMGLITNDCDEYLVWSKRVKKDLIQFHDISEKKIKIVGAIHWGHYFNDHLNRKNFFIKKYKLLKNCKTILLCFKSPTRTNLNDIKKIITNLSNLNLHFDYQILIRPHPIYYSKRFFNHIIILNKFIQKYKNIKIQNLYDLNKVRDHLKNKKSLSIDFILKEEKEFRENTKEAYLFSDMVISFFSTINIETAILNKPMINYFYSKRKKNYEKFGTKKNTNLDIHQNHIQPIINCKSARICFNKRDLELNINRYLKSPEKDTQNRKNFLNITLYQNKDCQKEITKFIERL